MDVKTSALVIIGIVAAILLIVAIFYAITAFRRMAITYKKIDYLVEDITYKSETLNSTVETISKVSNYLDIFEVVAQKNVKSAIKLVSRNRETIYSMAEKLKELALSEKDGKNKKGGK
ncbi:hypothetical protein MYMA111404_03265 [Mycoplasma marinum]|uniref:DUF948 domain-containing protein n=1 Tax=Mycoplasma marinum TaxID=1937190 RepID=A0A4R0XS31_9MOLU|nr:hypothetical protein [Mycoplasma marinum]TCG11230.1 hypothetical protein C4B24_02620 [Mycoplasma marinum]